MNQDTKLKICDALKTYGGGFDRALAECIIRADENNLERIVSAFPEIIAKGLAFADRFLDAEIAKQRGE
jgi:hypothetical protein